MATEDHLSLVEVIRGVHIELRKQYQACTNQDSVAKMWEEHCKEDGTLKKYATAMYQLANDHWNRNLSTQHLSTRIDWCHNVIIDYFFNGGMQKELKKDLKSTVYKDLKEENESFQPISNVWLLDVGSCYNPFKSYEELSSVALDICPATPDVKKCDFLNVEIISCKSEDEMTESLTTLSSPVRFLPEKSFHVVVFSLLLEYLPSPYQRILCCIKAFNLLKRNGLLLIITPDSKHQNHNAKMMKSWKSALASLGFKRIKYEKQTHLHCLAFRKVLLSSASSADGLKSYQEFSVIAHQLFIPQDFHDYLNSIQDVEIAVDRTDKDVEELKCGFMQLPHSCFE